jgi:hypothetical protein
MKGEKPGQVEYKTILTGVEGKEKKRNEREERTREGRKQTHGSD